MPLDDLSDPLLDHKSNVLATMYNRTIVQIVSPLVPRLRQTIFPFGMTSFHPSLALMPSEKTGGFTPTAAETITISSIVVFFSNMRVTLWTLNLVNMATMPHTDVGNHACSAAAPMANRVARNTTRKIYAISLANREGTTGSGPGKLSRRYHIHIGLPCLYPALARFICPRSRSSNALWSRP